MQTKFLLKFITTILFTPFYILMAGSPPNLVNDISLISCNCTSFAGNANAYFNLDTQIPTAFNFARRAEESYFGLTSGALGNLVLPSNYSTLTDYQKGLFLINSERAARGGIDYDGSGANPSVLGKILNGLDANLNTLSQTHAQYLQTNNIFTHVGAGGDSFARIQTQFGTQKEFMARSENLYVSCGGYNTHLMEQAIFSWLYQDASSSWGHRAAILIQDTDPTSGQNGFDDNYGAAGEEGILGFGILRDVSFPLICGPLRLSAENQILNPNLAGNIVVMMVLDPSTSFMNAPLPVNLISFNLEKNNNTIVLNWITNSEKDNHGFEIEKSLNGKKFEKVAYINAKNTLSEKNNYEYFDQSPSDGINYYRLKQIDLDGTFEYSPIKSINYESKIEITMYPNPAQNQLFFEGVKNGSKIEILNLSGKNIYTNSNYTLNTLVDIRHFNDGIYFVKITNGNNSIFRKFIVKK